MILLSRSYAQDGVHYFPESSEPFDQIRWFDKSEAFGSQAELVSYLSQLEEEGFGQFDGGGMVLPWDAVYQLLGLPEHRESIPLLGLAPIRPIAPNLNSSGGLTDQGFSIAIAGWRYENGTPVRALRERNGAIVELDGSEALLPEVSWRLVEAVKAFAAVPATERRPDLTRRNWANIRSLAIAAHAGLDNFLTRTVVLTPQKLRLNMRKVEINGTKVVEVIPEFDKAPPRWIEMLDRYNQVQNRYDIPEGAGLVHVMIEPAVKTVLSEIKRMPGRRVAGHRAEAFIRNPFALLGEEANQVISEEEFEDARQEAGIYFYRFTTQVERDDVGICGAFLLIESSQKGTVTTESYTFKNTDDLRKFIHELDDKLVRGMQLCAWEGWNLELLGDAEDQLRILQGALAEWIKPRPVIRLADVYDLSRYSQRVEEIGHEKPYHSPYIAKQNDDDGWFPNNISSGFFWTPEGTTEPIGVSLDQGEIDKIQADITKARADGRSEVRLKGCPVPVGLKEAENLVRGLRDAFEDVNTRSFPNPLRRVRASDSQTRNRLSLVVKPNIERLDYSEERRGATLERDGEREPRLPSALKPDATLLGHQLKGVAWLQQLWDDEAAFFRGALLADDMGLGKTLQLLTFVARCFEENPALAPVLVVAPLSLLENWNTEITKFFNPGFLKVETVYGDRLLTMRLRRSEIDAALVEGRLTRFLRPGWRGDANIVLTTYETLRDLEFSFSSEHWSIMICDEAQKTKNPNALVTRAAKKQNVRFKIACTGTPVENSLVDLWCLFDFIQPGLLSALSGFGPRYRRPIEAKTDEERERIKELRGIIAPQVMRRMKHEVAQDLPKKLIVDSCRGIPMSPYQKMLYGHAINDFKSQSSGVNNHRFLNHLGLLQYLRRLCTDPRPAGQLASIGESFDHYVNNSPKMRWLITELGTIQHRNEKTIIFTEYRDIQRLIREYVREKFGITPDIINGDTPGYSRTAPSRQKRIDVFQNRPGFGVIILSPLAVGVGLNIQAANHVIHYTRTWNPAKEDQATDRAHRIGQVKDVFVYCPIVIDPTFKTFEKKLDELLERKRDLSKDMLNGTGDLSGAQFEDLENVDGAPVMEDRALTIDDVIHLDSKSFECFCVILWQKKGYPVVYHRGRSGDGGVDVVALWGETGALIQAKSSLIEGQELGWEAVKDVVAGEAAYRGKHRGVSFTKYAVTNQFFNDTARFQAEANTVELVDQDALRELLLSHPVSMQELEHCVLG